MTKWFYYNESSEKIEVTGGQLKGLAKAGMITPETIVETEDGKKARAGKVKGLKFVEAEQPITSMPTESNPFTATSPTADSPTARVSTIDHTASQTVPQSVPVPIVEKAKISHRTNIIIFASILCLLLICWIGHVIETSARKKNVAPATPPVIWELPVATERRVTVLVSAIRSPLVTGHGTAFEIWVNGEKSDSTVSKNDSFVTSVSVPVGRLNTIEGRVGFLNAYGMPRHEERIKVRDGASTSITIPAEGPIEFSNSDFVNRIEIKVSAR